MSAVQANEPTVRQKNVKQDDEFVTIRVPKETGDDDQNPDALLHRYVGDDSEFKTGALIDQTRRVHVVQMSRKEAEAYNQEKIDEAKARVKAKAGLKGTSEQIRMGNGIPMDQLVKDLKGRVMKELSDANG